jgi:hypothetical protein
MSYFNIANTYHKDCPPGVAGLVTNTKYAVHPVNRFAYEIEHERIRTVETAVLAVHFIQ